MAYFLGVDIGGTKSHAMVADETGRIFGFQAGGPGNHEGVGYDGLRKTLREVTVGALAQARIETADLSGAGFGVAGYDWPGERQDTLDAIAVLGLGCPVEAVNDTLIGLLAGAHEGWGIAVVAGTGENCWGRDRRGRVGRMTGNGTDLGENGGAGSIVYAAVQAVSKAWSHRGPPTRLLQAMLAASGARDADALLEGIALGRILLTADFSRVVVRTADEGDAVARGILKWAGTELADLAAGVIRQLGFEWEAFEVVEIGSMFRSADILRREFVNHVRAIAPQARFVPLLAPPVTGAVLLGMEAAGIDGGEIRTVLASGAAKLQV